MQYTSELFLYFTEKKNGKRQKEERREIRSHERCRESVWAKRGCQFLPILCVLSTQTLAVLAWVDYVIGCHSITEVLLTLPA